jgi:electron transport complex protein RnfB
MDHTVDLVARVDAWLPQTQCTRCGYPRCRAYAEAIARGEADINQCPPGADTTIRALAQLLGVAPKPLNPANGAHLPRTRAVIDEARCIGCRKCLDVCPVDAIIGARKLMHTVIAAECTGCELCLPPCPVDCILMVAVPSPAEPASPWPEYARVETERWRERTEARTARLERRREERRAARRTRAPGPAPDTDRERIRAEIRAAVERVRSRKRGA